MSALVAVSTKEVVLHTYSPTHTKLFRDVWSNSNYLQKKSTVYTYMYVTAIYAQYFCMNVIGICVAVFDFPTSTGAIHKFK